MEARVSEPFYLGLDPDPSVVGYSDELYLIFLESMRLKSAENAYLNFQYGVLVKIIFFNEFCRI